MSLSGSVLTQIVAQGAENEEALSPYVVGGAVLLLFLLLLFGLFAFGKGREHS
ncbi:MULTISPECIES: hypothetical protein [Mumia]|uniref:Uncharacterized protein n=1 Tax=Mumia xiangluensis TaxID=1678900 RepID=A0ABW1QSW4_9ACTN|nr:MULTISPECIES: hypothetical protein [Mumia]